MHVEVTVNTNYVKLFDSYVLTVTVKTCVLSTLYGSHSLSGVYHLCVFMPCYIRRDIREAFIRAKYENKAWVPRSGGSPETLSKALCVSAATDNVQRSYELICGGASVSGEGCEVV